MSKDICYSIIIPAYNEESVINETYKRITDIMKSIGDKYELIFINDGSQDKTNEIIESLAQKDDCVRLLEFSRNFGHQIAISAGMDYAEGDAIVIIDADLQDPPEIIPEMIKKWREGFEVVYAKRLKRKGETLFKKWTAAAFYRILNLLTEVDIPLDTGDFRLIDRKVCDVMKQVREKNRFIRGLISWTGFRQTAIEYIRDERFAGETKYSLSKMLRLSMDGITSFSCKPLKLATFIGSLISLTSLVYLIIYAVQGLFFNDISLGIFFMILLLFINGLILINMGMMGEYIGRIYDEAKNRPLYIIRNKADQKELIR